MSEVRTVIFHGSLAKKYGKEHRFAFNNMKQFLSGLQSRLGAQIKEEIRVGKWHLFDGARKASNALDTETVKKLGDFASSVVHLMPATEASSGVVRFVIGVVLIAVGVYYAPWLVNIGASLALGGLVEMLTKQPNVDQNKVQDENASSIYNSARNVTTHGGPKPTVYGTVTRASSIVINSDFSSDEVA